MLATSSVASLRNPWLRVASRAMRVIAYLAKPDFVINVGDLIEGLNDGQVCFRVGAVAPN